MSKRPLTSSFTIFQSLRSLPLNLPHHPDSFLSRVGPDKKFKKKKHNPPRASDLKPSLLVVLCSFSFLSLLPPPTSIATPLHSLRAVVVDCLAQPHVAVPAALTKNLTPPRTLRSPRQTGAADRQHCAMAGNDGDLLKQATQKMSQRYESERVVVFLMCLSVASVCLLATLGVR